MSTFTCLCGHMTRDRDEPSGTSLVGYTLSALRSVEVRIAKQASEYFAHSSEAEQLAWQRAFYKEEEMPRQSSTEFVEDIVAGELNSEFIPIYRCPACSRIAVKRGDSEEWAFFKPESSGRSSS